MITIIIPAHSVEEAVAVRDRIKGLILVAGETATIADGGVAVRTDDPVRVCQELEKDGFF